jgi:apolipoprotein N-acyltransferase
MWWTWLTGTILLPLGMQRFSVGIAAVLAPALLLRFNRTAPSAWKGFAGIYLACLIAQLSVHTPAYTGSARELATIIAVVAAGLHSLGYLFDRVASRRLPAALACCVFPTYYIALELLAARTGPYGSMDAIAYSLSGFPALLQLASVTGLAGLAFLVYAFAPCANLAWENKSARAWLPLQAYALTLVLVLILGGVRLAKGLPEGPTVSVAAVALDSATYTATVSGSVRDVASGEDALRQRVREHIQPAHEQLIRKTEQAIAAGAQLIAWPETVVVLEEDLPQLLARASALAAEHHVFLVVTPWVVKRTTAFPLGENLSIGIDQNGKEVWRYNKQRPVPGIEVNIARGEHAAPLVDTSLGRLTSAICFDNDFPQLLREVTAQGADLLVAPSDDWPQIARVHSAMFGLHAIENGVSIVKPTHNGISVIVDPLGRVQAELDTIAAQQPFALAQIPRHGVTTLYSRGGDWFAVLGAIAFVVLLIAACLPRKRVAR